MAAEDLSGQHDGHAAAAAAFGGVAQQLTAALEEQDRGFLAAGDEAAALIGLLEIEREVVAIQRGAGLDLDP